MSMSMCWMRRIDHAAGTGCSSHLQGNIGSDAGGTKALLAVAECPCLYAVV
ncbi:hypothetical protein [Oceanobacter sp. 3_MG-2023]|uniref:hypothetical protein n=1 Tax=Oceanobacter sp. 3_MG-2023 TaxID=3062622 RepID=UPI002736A3C6|nr:hypothetical protein [Oceanobacter sp. 3_MG-2023]MDP2506382.1 hypothetical protein [Oceanobacter sp. 3_MG-2023]